MDPGVKHIAILEHVAILLNLIVVVHNIVTGKGQKSQKDSALVYKYFRTLRMFSGLDY